MRLLTKTSLLIITVSTFIFMVGNLLFFNISKEMINRHVNNELISQMHQVMKQLSETDLNHYSNYLGDDIQITPLVASKEVRPHVYDTVIYSSIQHKFIPHRALKFSYRDSKQHILVTMYKSLLSSDKLIERITLASILMVMMFILMIFILNRYIFGNVWAVFFANLEKVEKYDVKSKQKLVLEETEVEEFAKLNQVQLKMVDRIQQDFVNLKELTANTSHEIQTPLAIIKSKAELLLQSENMRKNELDTVSTILSTSERLAKLNQSLLLITKIENNQFEENSTVRLDKVVEKLLQNYDILISAGEFKVSTHLNEVKIVVNPTLLDILLSNLIKNAIVHGIKGGQINIFIEKNYFKIFNSGEPLVINQDDIFKRFVKASHSSNSSGLGLEIVRKICEFYNLQIDYVYDNQLHCFSIDFSNILFNI